MLNGCVRFGDFEAELTTGHLRRAGTPVPIQDLPFRLLAALVERPGELVTRAELTTRLWGSDTFVDAAAGLNTAVAKLRDALEDNAERPAYIETVPKRGYRFVAKVEPIPTLSTAPPPSQPPTQITAPPATRLKHVGLMAALAAVLFVAVATYQLRAELGRVRAGRGQTRVAVVLFDNETGRAEMSRFAQGMTDAVVTELTTEPRLAVIGNASVLRTERPFRDIARVRDTLNAEYIVIGQVQTRDDNTIVRAHLIRARDQAHVWVNVAEWTSDGEAAFQRVVAERIRTAVASAVAQRPCGPTLSWSLSRRARRLRGAPRREHDVAIVDRQRHTRRRCGEADAHLLRAWRIKLECAEMDQARRPAGAGEHQLLPIDFDLDAFFVGSLQLGEILGGQRLGGQPIVRAFDRFQVLDDRLGAVAAGHRVTHQRDAVRSLDFLDSGRCGDVRLDRVDVAEHRRRKNRRPGAVGEEELGDFAVAHVRGRVERRLEVAEAPVVVGLGERRMKGDQFLDARDLAVRHADHLAHHFRILRGKGRREGAFGGAGPGNHRAKRERDGRQQQRTARQARRTDERHDGQLLMNDGAARCRIRPMPRNRQHLNSR
jgi:DNA-binding winged helix-turn-helix (wHTH) protein/TolB-like protein